MARELRADWVRELIGLELLASLALLVAAHAMRPARGEPDRGLLRWAGAATPALPRPSSRSSASCCSPARVSRISTTAPSSRTQDRRRLRHPFSSPTAAIDWGIAALAAAIHRRAPALARRGDSPWPGLLRVLAGLVIWFTVARTAPFSLAPSGNQEALPLVLAWVAVLAPGGSEEHPSVASCASPSPPSA